jgi:hypothetical protein
MGRKRPGRAKGSARGFGAAAGQREHRVQASRKPSSFNQQVKRRQAQARRRAPGGYHLSKRSRTPRGQSETRQGRAAWRLGGASTGASVAAVSSVNSAIVRMSVGLEPGASGLGSKCPIGQVFNGAGRFDQGASFVAPSKSSMLEVSS